MSLIPKNAAFLAACLALLAGCVTPVPAPGAAQIHLTDKSADVAGCTAVGNIHLTKVEDGVVDLHETRFRNAVVGLGGNSALVTVGALIAPQEGIAYRCPPLNGT
jgi:hypothetical protein